jgi:hypothetical protein
MARAHSREGILVKAGLCVGLAVLICAPLAAQEPLPQGSSRGRVLDAQTGEPIAKALVSIRNRKLAAVTDASGCFTLTDVPLPAEIMVTTMGSEQQREPCV